MALQSGRSPAALLARIGEPTSVEVIAFADDVDEYNVVATPTTTPDVTMYLSDYKIADIDGTNVQSGDRKAFLDGAAAPANFDAKSKIVVAGLTYEIVGFDPKRVGGDVIYYRLQLRGSG